MWVLPLRAFEHPTVPQKLCLFTVSFGEGIVIGEGIETASYSFRSIVPQTRHAERTIMVYTALVWY